MVALACSTPPEGYARWSLRLLADRVVQMKIIDSLSHETVRQVLDDNELKPWRREEWCIPTANPEFVFTWKMFWMSINVRLIRNTRWYASMKARNNWLVKLAKLCR